MLLQVAQGVVLVAYGLIAIPTRAEDAPPAVYPAPTQWWQVYDPTALLNLNVQLTAADYAKIQADETFDIEVPAVFWVDNIAPDPGAWSILIRRKSATPIGEKISYRLKFEAKIGEGSARWCNIKSLSQENGDDNNVVSMSVQARLTDHVSRRYDEIAVCRRPPYAHLRGGEQAH